MIFDWLMQKPGVLNKLWSTSNASNYCWSLAMPYEMVYVKESAWYGIWDLSVEPQLLIFQVQSPSQTEFKKNLLDAHKKHFKMKIYTVRVFQKFWHQLCLFCRTTILCTLNNRSDNGQWWGCLHRKIPHNFLIFNCFSLFKHQHLPNITWLSR